MMTQQPKRLGEGEQRLQQSRNRYWRYFGVIMLTAAGVGVLTGALGDAFDNGYVPQAVFLAIIAAIAIGFVWLCFDYYRRLDEVDLMDNLWAATVALNAGFLVWFVWWVLGDAGITVRPQATPILLGMLIINLGVYLARKTGLR